jgi:hypothetical protein
MPERIQRRRVRGWSKPGNCVIVDRTSRFGNPFKIGEDADDAAHATALYTEWLMSNSITCLDPYAGIEYLDAMNRRRDWILTHAADLRGKDLACFCELPAEGEPDHCHAAALISLVDEIAAANADRPAA